MTEFLQNRQAVSGIEPAQVRGYFHCLFPLSIDLFLCIFLRKPRIVFNCSLEIKFLKTRRLLQNFELLQKLEADQGKSTHIDSHLFPTASLSKGLQPLKFPGTFKESLRHLTGLRSKLNLSIAYRVQKRYRHGYALFSRLDCSSLKFFPACSFVTWTPSCR